MAERRTEQDAEGTRGSGATRPGSTGGRALLLVLAAVYPTLAFATAFPLQTAPGPSFLTPVAGAWRALSVVLFPMSLLAYVVAAPALGISGALAPRGHRWARLWLALAVLVGAGMVFAMIGPFRALRMWGVSYVPKRTRPLVASLDRFREDRGHYPGSLEELVPSYLPRVPETGMIGYPEFRYRRGAEANERAGGYDLYVSCGWGFVWDSLHYWPSQAYPEKAYGGVVERVDGWAYVHE